MAKHTMRRGHFESHTSTAVLDHLSDVDDPIFDSAGIFLSDTQIGNNGKQGEVFGGWEVVDIPGVHRERCSTKKRPNDLPLNPDSSVNHVANNIHNAKLYSQTVRADIEYSNAPIWKTCVEPTTYRYVPNNGRYRSSKAIVPKFAVQKPVKRLAETKLNPEQRKLQKEIQRELRKEFELAGRKERSRPSVVEPLRSQSPPAGDWGEEDGSAMKVSFVPKRSVKPDKPHSPVVLPPITIPVLSSESQDAHSSNHFNMFHGASFRDREGDSTAGVNRRSRHKDTGASKLSRSRSEPPQPASRTTQSSRDQTDPSFELSPNKLHRESSYGSIDIQKTPKGHRRKPERLEKLITNREGAWTSNPNLVTEGSHMDMYYGHQNRYEEYVTNSRERSVVFEGESRSRKSSQSSRKSDLSPTSSTAPVPVTQIKYMAASGEVSKIPKFGRNVSDLEAPDDFYSSIERENPTNHNVLDMDENRIHVKSTTDKLKSVMTTRFIHPIAVRHASQDTAVTLNKLKHPPRGTHLFTDSNSTKLVAGGFRGLPMTQLKITDKVKAPEPPKALGLSILPQIAGRKVIN